MHSSRPKLKMTCNAVDTFLEILGWCTLTLCWIVILVQYDKLPSLIPIHFDLFGKPDAFGNKGNIFILPFVASILFLGLTWLNRYPHVFNFPVQLTEENTYVQYQLATRLLRWLKWWIVLLFFTISLQSMNVQTYNYNWLLPCLLGGTFVGLITYLIAAAKKS